MESKIKHESSASAAVNADEQVTLYAEDGESIQVSASKVDSWLRRGFSTQAYDLDALSSELDALGDAIGKPWKAYVDACRKRGCIDSAAQDTAHESLRLFCEAADKLHRAIHAKFSTKEEA